MDAPFAFSHGKARREYGATKRLSRAQLLADPLEQFLSWLQEAEEKGEVEPNAFALATATRQAVPSVRFVLMKHIDKEGLLFFTNYGSRKGRELADNPLAAATFFWPLCERQVRLEGSVVRCTRAMSDHYFAIRPRAAQLACWASQQSRPVGCREELEAAYADYELLYGEQPVPLPPEWGGYRLLFSKVELWQGGSHRLHDRFLYSSTGPCGEWTIERLAP